MKKKILLILSICSILSLGISGCLGKDKITKTVDERNFMEEELNNTFTQILYGCPISKKKKRRRIFP